MHGLSVISSIDSSEDAILEEFTCTWRINTLEKISGVNF